MYLAMGLLVVLLGAASGAESDCVCVCVEGRPQTLCASLEAARQGVDRCVGRAPDTCPAALTELGGTRYPAPVDGAVDCRDAAVWAGASGGPVQARICDLEAPD
jgi:hypothetical protein